MLEVPFQKVTCPVAPEPVKLDPAVQAAKLLEESKHK